MGNGVPLLNEYKQKFFWKRFSQTVLGGLKFNLRYRAPAYVYVNQLLLFTFPWILGGLFTVLVELTSLRFDIACYVYGVLSVLFVICVQGTSWLLSRRRGVVSPSAKDSIIRHNILNEDDEVEFESCCGRETVNFVSPRKPVLALIPLHSALAGLLCGSGLWYLLPSVLQALYSSNTGVTVALYIFGWLTLCIGQYSLTLKSPPEVSSFRALSTYDVFPPRPLYMAMCMVLHVVAM